MINDDDYMRKYIVSDSRVPSNYFNKMAVWDIVKADLSCEERENIRRWNSHHRIMPEILNYKWRNVCDEGLIKKWRTLVETAEIPVKLTAEDLGLEGKGHSLSPRFDKIDCETDIKYRRIKDYIMGGMALYMCTLIINSGDISKTARILRPYFKKLVVDKTNSSIVSVYDNTKRTVIMKLYPGVVYFKKWNILVSRNFFLMIKDILIARGHSMISLLERPDLGDEDRNVFTINRMYEIGDKILRAGASSPYSGIKLLEPYCNARLSALASEYRPKIPKFTRLYEHLKRTVGNLDVLIQDPVKELFELMEDQTEPQIIVNMFGSFRHWGHPYIRSQEGLDALRERYSVWWFLPAAVTLSQPFYCLSYSAVRIRTLVAMVQCSNK